MAFYTEDRLFYLIFLHFKRIFPNTNIAEKTQVSSMIYNIYLYYCY